MAKRKPIDVEELKKTFRINNGKLERIDLRRTDGKWKVVENKAMMVMDTAESDLMAGWYFIMLSFGYYQQGKDIPQGMEIDHINGNKIDNRIKNLRLVSRRQNTQNKQMHRDGRLAGISLCKETKKYIVILWVNIKYINIGRFKTEQQAHEAYTIACKHILDYKDNKSFRELIKKEMEGKV